jgi:hypothetical protein
MKIIQYTLMAILLTGIFACSEQTKFGEAVAESEAITTDQLVERLDAEFSFDVTVKGLISDACRSEGCWLEITSTAGTPVFVTYKNEAFTLPLGITGRTAILKGRAFVDSTTVEEQRAEAKEEGLSEDEIMAIQETVYSLSLEATGVELK